MEDAQDAPTSTCPKCTAPMEPVATKCQKCGEWRSDIKADRKKAYLWSGATIAILLVFLYGHENFWWPPRLAGFDRKLATGEIMRRIDPTTPFAWSSFFDSPVGLLLLLAFGASAAFMWKHYSSASKKMNKWIWF